MQRMGPPTPPFWASRGFAINEFPDLDIRLIDIEDPASATRVPMKILTTATAEP